MIFMKNKIKLAFTFADIISVDNLLGAWREFIRGKRNKKDVQIFELRLMNNILSLHSDLRNRTYRHGPYQHFKISDPKPRDIHKASVRDRLLHHALHRVLYPFFNQTFISDSFSCRNDKGTHKALGRFCDFACSVSMSHTKTCWVLKCDIRKFFANIDHKTLFSIVAAYIGDQNILRLIREVVESFSSGESGIGLPLGNLISQLFVNVYMNEFDQFMKHRLKAKYYIRFADDFVIFGNNKEGLENILPCIEDFLLNKLKLSLHPSKILIKAITSGVDYLGWVHFSTHRVLRTSTKRRMFRTLANDSRPEVVNSYLGLLKHGNSQKLRNQVIKHLINNS